MIKFVPIESLPPSDDRYFQLYVDGVPSMIYSENMLHKAFIALKLYFAKDVERFV